MVRANTCRVVADVVNKHARWDRAMIQFPRNTVSREALPVYIELAIPEGFRPCPSPAGIALLYLGPKAFSQILLAVVGIEGISMPKPSLVVRCAPPPRLSRFGASLDAALHRVLLGGGRWNRNAKRAGSASRTCRRPVPGGRTRLHYTVW